MNELDFTLELNADGVSQRTELALFTEAEGRLKELAEGHQDMTGAAINIREAGKGQQTFLFEATVVVYIRPTHIAATNKNPDPVVAVRQALEAVERQVREQREKLGKPWQQPGSYVPYEEALPEMEEMEEDTEIE